MADQPTIYTFITQIKHGDTPARINAVLQAQLIGSDAILPLATVYGSGDGGASRSACEAIKRIVDNACRPGGGAEAKAVSVALLKIVTGNYPRYVRADAIEGLGIVGGAPEATELAKLLTNKELGEDARLALERIPGPEVELLIKEASRTAPKELRAALELSLRHRRTSFSKVGLK